MIPRKKKLIDGMDRDILRLIYRSHPQTLSGAQIAKGVTLSPPAIKPRLINLKNQGIVRQVKCGNMRNFERTFGKQLIKISAPSKICWGLDLKKRKK
jgi:DNA-binding Lrp family transcriptional regulator